MISVVLQLEAQLSELLGWPSWALITIQVLIVCVIAASVLETVLARRASERGTSTQAVATTEFRLFQLQYLGVYLTIMLADWLQGTNMYTLYSVRARSALLSYNIIVPLTLMDGYTTLSYLRHLLLQSYGVNVGTLFLTGFLSSAVFGTFLGMYVDSYGRRLGCIVFCVLEVVINLLEHVPNMPTLMVGRVLGGMSTSLLFTAFESWMVSEHRKRGFDESLLASTFSIASWGNGFSAILAGFLAQIAADVAGDIGPFQLAIVLTVLTLVPILFWRENYGTSSTNSEEAQMCSIDDKGTVTCGIDADSSLLASMRASVDHILQHPAVLFLGLSQACFEGAVYTFGKRRKRLFFLYSTYLSTAAAMNDNFYRPTPLQCSCGCLRCSSPAETACPPDLCSAPSCWP